MSNFNNEDIEEKLDELIASQFETEVTEFIEGKRNNYFISSSVAEITNQKPDYMKLRGINDDYCKKIIIDYIKKFKTAKKGDLEEILLEKLGDSMTDIQKKNKIKNILQSLRRDGVIEPHGKEWILCKK